ncbi:hypothetical protein [Alcaligenes sp. SDU_A2]|uniref:hypothetical protein n=1 Tax=Alcaligenes sp. SDU_A2 TaxID=3136634 RepID=UPI0031201BA8
MSLDSIDNAFNTSVSVSAGVARPQESKPGVVPENVVGQPGNGNDPVTLSSAGKGLFLTSKQADENYRDADIDNSSLPDGIKELLKRIRDLKAQIQKKMAELQRIQADMQLSEPRRKYALERAQSELSILNGALTKASAMLLKAMEDARLDSDARMQVSELLIK